MPDQLADRVAARHRQAKEFPTEEALEWYLENHPKADKSNHWVSKDGPDKSAPDEERGEHKKPAPDEERGEHKKPSGFKGFSEKVTSALKKTPAAVQKFFSDKEHRKETLSKATAAVKGSPKKYAKNLIDAAKEEVHEFKEAGSAIRDIFKGKKLNAHQKKAVKTVAIHMGVTMAAAALAAPTVLGGAAYFGQAVAKHVALKAASKAMADLHFLGKVGDVGSSVLDWVTKFGAENGEPDPHEALAALIMAKVNEEIENLSDEDLEALMEEATADSDEQTTKEANVTWREDIVANTADVTRNFGALLDRAESIHKALRSWIRKFPGVLRQAEQEAEGLGSGLVWQDLVVDYWKETDAQRDRLFEMDLEADSLWSQAGGGKLRNMINEFRGTLDPVDHKARVEYGFGDPQFFSHPKTNRQAIAYPVKRLEDWSRACEAWVESSLKVIQKARKVV